MKYTGRKFLVALILTGLTQAVFAEEATLPPETKPLALQDAFALALKRSETIAISKDVIGEAEARFVQALGTMLPHVSATSVDTVQEKAAGSAMTDVMFNHNHTFERSLVVTQRLFSGFRELAAVKGSGFEKSQRTHEYNRAKQLLWVDVSGAFYLLVQQRMDLHVLTGTQTALEDRIKELEERVRVGRSRKSEIVNTQSQLYSLLAEIELVKSQEKVARDLLEYLTGTAVGEVADTEGVPELQNESDYETSSQTRLDIKALEDAFAVAQQQLTVARSGLWPTVDLGGAYFLERNTAPEDSRWSAALTVNLPIFNGTETYGQIAQAKLQAHESRLQLERQRRLSLYDCSTYALVAAEVIRCQDLKMAVDSAEENYRLQQEDYRMSLVSNLDVLAAIQLSNDARRNFVRSLYLTKQLYERLLFAAGTAPTDALT